MPRQNANWLFSRARWSGLTHKTWSAPTAEQLSPNRTAGIPTIKAGLVQFGLHFVFGAGCCADEAQSQAAFAILAMTLSRVASSAEESETKTATARCRPSGRVIMPMSLVAEVMPF